MPRFDLTIDLNNLTRSEYRHEVVRILKETAETIERGAYIGNCRDTNGKKIGQFDFITDNEK